MGMGRGLSIDEKADADDSCEAAKIQASKKYLRYIQKKSIFLVLLQQRGSTNMMVGCVDWTRRGQVNEMMCRNESNGCQNIVLAEKTKCKIENRVPLSRDIMCITSISSYGFYS